jgi:hypothetical protein
LKALLRERRLEAGVPRRIRCVAAALAYYTKKTTDRQAGSAACCAGLKKD